jgi:trehalose 6-phosphate phosphatase
MTSGRTLDEEAVRLRGRAGNVALCLDFDGTLAPIVDDPELSAPSPGVVETLARLATKFAAVAIVSGRPAAFLVERAAAAGVRYLGLYGLQEIRGDDAWLDPRLAAALGSVVAARDDLRRSAVVRTSGAHLEDKEYAVAVHTRRLADPERWTAQIDATVRQIAQARGLEMVPGRLVWELRPAVRDDKGDALRRVVRESGARAVVVIGDDLGDVPAFAAAAQLTAEGVEMLRVAVRSTEAPAALLAAADYIVDGPPGVATFLERLAGN